jgi:pimeloyl-ACP methyl ester carboxylesterase
MPTDTAVIALHGFLSSTESSTLKPVRQALEKERVAVLLMELNDRIGDRVFAQSTPAIMVERTLEHVTKAKDKFKQVILLGHSLGGAIALEAARSFPVDGLILLATPTRFMNLEERFFSEEQREEFLKTGMTTLVRPDTGLSFLIKQDFTDQVRLLDPVTTARDVDCSALLVYAGEDKAVSRESAEEMFLAFAGKKDLLFIGGAKHNFREQPDALVAAVVNFVKNLRRS